MLSYSIFYVIYVQMGFSKWPFMCTVLRWMTSQLNTTSISSKTVRNCAELCEMECVELPSNRLEQALHDADNVGSSVHLSDESNATIAPNRWIKEFFFFFFRMVFHVLLLFHLFFSFCIQRTLLALFDFIS